MSFENGHLSPTDEPTYATLDTKPSHSESELSDVNDIPDQTVPESIDHVMQDAASPRSDEDEDADGSDDADYDAPSPPSRASVDSRHSSVSSEASSLPRKRKAEPDVDDEQYMQENPELYGLRRSGRARPTRRIIESSDEEQDDNDSGSDVNPGRARKRLRPATSRNGITAPTPRFFVVTDIHVLLVSARQTDSESGTDSDTYGGARGREFAKRHRRRLQGASSRSASGLAGDLRFSTRQAGKVTTYNEEDGDDFSEEDTENLTPNYWAAAEDDSPGIDVVLNHRIADGKDTEYPEKTDYEFFIKWQGKAHYHATWEPWTELTSVRGFRRLENYYRKTVEAEQFLAQDPDVAPEEREKYTLDRETYLDALDDYMKVERVIGEQIGNDGREYYVKWKSLAYDFCTWEPESLVSELAQNEIDRYLDRSSRLPTSDKRESNLSTRSPYKPFRTQPDYVKFGQLRDFQLAGINFLAHNWCKGNNVILADEMGLGKTVQSVSFMSWLIHDRRQEGPFLVVVPLSTMPAWADTFNNWTPDINYIVYNGNEASRKILREHELLVDGNPKKTKFNVMLTTYEYILLDSAFLSQMKWQFMAVDEAHRLKNRDSQLYVKLMDFGAPSRLLITGTPLQNELKELSALMDFLMPGLININDDIPIDDSEATRQALDELMKAISPYMIRRVKENVTSDLPGKTEKIIRVELSDVQLEYYKNILTRNYAALNSGTKGQKQSLLNIMMELKKASNHPFMFPNAEDRILEGKTGREDQLKALVTSSGKMMLLDRLLTRLKADGHRVLIFSQMVKMLDIVGDYLHLRGHQYQRLDGTIAAGPRRQAIDHFNAPDSKDFCFILSTRAGGLGINLMTADTVILFDSDWNPQADLQAMARAHRIGQKNPVTIYRFVSKDTVEEEVLERARNKLILEHITIHQAMTEKEAKALRSKLDSAGVSTAEPVAHDDLSRILKRRGQKMFEQSGNQRKLEELDIDAVLENAEIHQTEQAGAGITASGGADFLKSFEYTDVKLDLEWDEIIPKEHLEAIKAEEKAKDEAQYLESVIEENQPRGAKRKSKDENDREQRAAKKRARDLAAQAAADIESDNESNVGADPQRPMSEKDIRNLIRAYEKYGSIDERQNEVVKEARLVGRNIDLLKATLDDVVGISKKLLQDEQDRVLALERETNKPITKKDKKAVLFDYKGVKRLNAETLTERPLEMRMLRDVEKSLGDNWRTFRIPEASKPAHYTCPWGAREDGMLCIGIAKHGYGAWVAIRDDPDLGMTDKFYLEEHRVGIKEERTKADEKNAKSPGAVHLVRRANYLLSVLKDKTSNGTNLAAKRALENHHRNNKKALGSSGRRPTSVSASPAPGAARKMNREDSYRSRLHNDHRGSSDRRQSSNNVGHRASPGGAERVDRNRHHRDSEPRKLPRHAGSPLAAPNGDRPAGEDHMRRIVEPIRDCLGRIRKATKSHIPDDKERANSLKESLQTAGIFFKQKAAEKGKTVEDKLWDYLAETWWPQAKNKDKRTSGQKLRTLYEKIAASAKPT
ncbi:SNF2 family DNA-dependent chromodomain-containing ATPase [Aureobasidium pullulans]|nr:SNF2 family DNA-dependent chromodomain-containing ATPase [Aureobasidium pullulans]